MEIKSTPGLGKALSFRRHIWCDRITTHHGGSTPFFSSSIPVVVASLSRTGNFFPSPAINHFDERLPSPGLHSITSSPILVALLRFIVTTPIPDRPSPLPARIIDLPPDIKEWNVSSAPDFSHFGRTYLFHYGFRSSFRFNINARAEPEAQPHPRTVSSSRTN